MHDYSIQNFIPNLVLIIVLGGLLVLPIGSMGLYSIAGGDVLSESDSLEKVIPEDGIKLEEVKETSESSESTSPVQSLSPLRLPPNFGGN